jgi:hypothetical protein
MKCRRFRVGPIVVAVCLLWPAQASQAQPFPESSRQKAQEERKKADEKANDEDYKALINASRVPTKGPIHGEGCEPLRQIMTNDVALRSDTWGILVASSFGMHGFTALAAASHSC